MPKKSKSWLDKHLLAALIIIPIITGIISGLLSTYLYANFISPPLKPNLVMVYTQTTFTQTPNLHYIHIYVFNNGSAPAQYLNLDIGLTNDTGYWITNVSQPYGAVSAVRGINLNGYVSPFSIYMSTIAPGQWESVDASVSNYSVQEGNNLVLSSPVKTYLTINYSSDSHVSIFNYSETGTTNNWTRTLIK